MSGSVNKWIGLGNLARDPESRALGNGERVVNMTVACGETWRDKQTGERKERTEFVRVVIFNQHLAEVAEKYLRKGSKVYLEGQLQTRKWTDKDGVEKYSTEIVLTKFKGELALLDARTGDTGGASVSGRGGDNFGGFGGGNSGADLDDEVPF